MPKNRNRLIEIKRSDYMSRKKTHEEFVEEMKIVNPNIKIVSRYQSAQEKVMCNCLICDNDWPAKPNNLLNYKGCR